MYLGPNINTKGAVAHHANAVFIIKVCLAGSQLEQGELPRERRTCELRRKPLPRNGVNRGERKPPVNPSGDPLANIRELVPPKG
jgi:hypothetical protein